MNPYAISFISAFVVSLCLGTYVLAKDPHHPLNRLFALFTYAGAVLCLSEALVKFTVFAERALVYYKIGALGLFFMPSLLLHFALVFTQKERILKKKLLYVLLYLPPLILLYLYWTTDLFIAGVKKLTFGYEDIWGRLFIPMVLYLLLYYTVPIYFFVQSCIIPISSRHRRQCHIIVLGILIGFAIGVSSDFVFPLLSGGNFPPLSPFAFLLFLCFFIYAITRYQLMTVTPATVAKDIMTIMPDGLILVSPQAKILEINQALLNLLGYRKEELVDQPIGMILEEEEEEEVFKNKHLKKVLQQGCLRDIDLTFRSKAGEKIPVSFNASVLRNKEDLIGVVIVARDMREINKLITDLDTSRTELQKKVKELEDFHDLAVGRELKMKKMEKELEELKSKARKYE